MMKCIYSLFAASLCLGALSLQGQVQIDSFNYWSPSSSYGEWAPEKNPATQSGADNWTVSATGFGGAYRYLGASGSTPSLIGMTTLELDVTVTAQSNGGAGIGFLVFLEDRDGTVYRYSYFGNREGTHQIKWALDSPRSKGAAGAIEGFNFGDIQAINIQVDPGGANSYTVSFNELRATSEVVAATPTLKPASGGYTLKQGVSYIDQPGNPRYARCVMDLYCPENQTDFATVVWIHAGGLRQGGRYIPGELREQGFAVLGIDYSLYPNAKAPEFIEDAAAAVAWAFHNIEGLGGSKEKIFVAGASAGGYLSMMVGLDTRWLAEYAVDANQLAGIISLSGQTITHVAVREEQGGNRAKPVVDALAPLNHVRGDAPPLLLVTGDRELELLGRYEENAYLQRMMLINGHQATELHEIKGMDHGGVEKPGHAFLLEFVKRIAK